MLTGPGSNLGSFGFGFSGFGFGLAGSGFEGVFLCLLKGGQEQEEQDLVGDKKKHLLES